MPVPFDKEDPLLDLHEFLASIDFSVDELDPQLLRGLSNHDYRVRSGGVEYIVRLASDGASDLGIDRRAEAQALRSTFEAGLGAEVVYYVLPEGHMISKAIDAPSISENPECYRDPEVLRRFTQAMKRIHDLPAVDHVFDPFRRIRTAIRRATEQSVRLPQSVGALLDRIDEIEARRGEVPTEHLALCHNDLFGGNILDDAPICFIDWEFVGMGDSFFDLATLAIACDEFEPLPDERSEIIVEAYFGDVTDAHRQRIKDMIFVVQMHNVSWGLTHHLLGTAAHGWEGFTFLGFATELLEHIVMPEADTPTA